MIIMKRMVFSLSVEYRVSSIDGCAGTVSGPLLLYKSFGPRWAQKDASCELKGPVRSAAPHASRTGCGKSTRDLQIFRLAYHRQTLSGGPAPRPSSYSRTGGPESTRLSKIFSSSGRLAHISYSQSISIMGHPAMSNQYFCMNRHVGRIVTVPGLREI